MSLFVLDTVGDKNLLKKNANLQNNGCTTALPLLGIKASKELKTSSVLESLAENDDRPTEEIEDEDYFGLPPPSVDIKNIINDTLAIQSLNAKSANKSEQELAYVKECVNAVARNVKKPKKKPVKRLFKLDHSDFNPLTKTYDADDQLSKVDVEKELSNGKLTPGLEQEKGLPMRHIKQQRTLNRVCIVCIK